MTEEEKNDILENENIEKKENQEEQTDVAETEQEKGVEELKKELAELNDKFLRLYADFENYKRLAAKNKEELIKYSNEELMKELLSVIDHLELALQHSANSENSLALAEGVDMTLKEIKATLEKFGLESIESLGNPFDPSVHHAIAQVETEDNEENVVVTEFRKGYKLRDRVLRAALVGVSKKPSRKVQTQETEEEE
ncbi:MAG: nucleotide exchange factor GrpE [Thermodesulfovibrionia bacterium]|nr:nucleotide exchange factor GrpE [Thermodesulfovibrionia bacterium]MCK5511840.1 nucleotide exchange factor GrpE [Thermodesulfovibrionia bacterium]